MSLSEDMSDELTKNRESDCKDSTDETCDQENLDDIKKSKVLTPKKKKKKGIIYLSFIPKHMNVMTVREMFSTYGNVGRMYLQPAENVQQSKKHAVKKKAKANYTEGWIEFESKKVAKYVAATLNNTQISTRKKSKFYDVLWNIKYLPRFKWVHLSERLAYERAVHKQRLRTEIAQARKEANFFSQNLDISKKLRKKEQEGQTSSFIMPAIKQRDTDMEIRSKKKEPQSENRIDILKSLFS